MSESYTLPGNRRLAVAYLARGADEEPLERFHRFSKSYRSFRSGVEHDLFIIFKGYRDERELKLGQAVFDGLRYTAIHTDDDNFDIGAYRAVAEQIPHDLICCMNTNSEIMCSGWLGKLAINFDQPSMGIVGATGSFETLWLLDYRFPRFPNIHVRSNAFIMRREHILRFFPRHIQEKKDAFFVESGPASITRRLFEIGLSVAVVGRNGRGYPPQWWPQSETFRSGTQSNLLVHDNVTRGFETMPWHDKKASSQRTWQTFLQDPPGLLFPGRLA